MWALYYAPKTCSLASNIALEEVSAPYEAKRIDFANGDQNSSEFLRLNPKGRVPALVTERGVLSETPAILLFIAQSFPDAKLAPLHDPFALAQLLSFNSYICSTLHVAHAHKLRGHRWTDDAHVIEALRKKVPETVGASFDFIEKEFLHGEWVLGEHYSVADIYLFTVAQWIESDGLDPHRFPKVLAHRQRLAERPAVQRVMVSHNG